MRPTPIVRLLAVLLAAVTLLAPGSALACGNQSSPEAVWQAARAAADQEKWGEMFQCLDPAARDDMLKKLYVGTLIAAVFRDDMHADLIALLADHGITDVEPGSEQIVARLQQLEDKTALYADLWTLVSRYVSRREKKAFGTLRVERQDGDTATGAVEVSRQGQTFVQRINFSRRDGKWYMGGFAE